jgi:hypothetical protein
MKKKFATAMAVCAVLLIGVGILAILNEPEVERAAYQRQRVEQSTKPQVKQKAQTEQAKPTKQAKQTEQTKPTEPAKPTEPPGKRDLRNGDHATVKMKTFACKTMAYFDRWVALTKSNDDEELKRFTSAIRGDCKVISKGDEVIVEQLGQVFLYNACVRKLGDIDCRWLRLSMLEASE